MILFGLINLLMVLLLRSGNFSSGLTQTEIQQVMTTTSILGLAGFVMLVGGIGGFLNKKWSKKLALGAIVLAIIGQVYDGNILYPVIYAGIGLLVYFKG